MDPGSGAEVTIDFGAGAHIAKLTRHSHLNSPVTPAKAGVYSGEYSAHAAIDRNALEWIPAVMVPMQSMRQE